MNHKYMQMSLYDICNEVHESIEENKQELVRILTEHIEFDIPLYPVTVSDRLLCIIECFFARFVTTNVCCLQFIYNSIAKQYELLFYKKLIFI